MRNLESYAASKAAAGVVTKTFWDRRQLDDNSLQNPKVRIFRFCIWMVLMCVAGSITGLEQPDRAIRDVSDV